MNGCCNKNLDNAVRVGRASYICPVCSSEVSLAHAFYMDSKLRAEELNKKKKDGRK